MATASKTSGGGLPLGAIAANVVGGLFLAAGVLGLYAPDALGAVPALKDPATAWTLIGVGALLDLGAAATIMGHLKSRRAAS